MNLTKFSCLAAACGAVLLSGWHLTAKAADQIAGTEIDPLTRPDVFSLLRTPGQLPASGYYPMGFVHGNPERVVQFGYNLVQGYSSDDSRWLREKQFSNFSSANEPHTTRLEMNAYSAARPKNILLGIMNTAIRKNGATSVRVKAYGELRMLLSQDGKPKAVSVFDPPTRQYLLDYSREHVKSRVADPRADRNIVMWGMDNEWEGWLDYSPMAKAAFVPWLEKAYGGDIAALNESWRTNLTGFSGVAAMKMPGPQEYKENPGLYLDWHEFQTQAFTGVMAEMGNAMRDADPRRRELVHKATQQTIEMPVTNRDRVFDNALFADLMRAGGSKLYGIDAYGNGDRETYEINFLHNCIRGNDGKDAGAGIYMAEANNHNGPGHQFASTWWRLLANGLKGVNFFTLGFAGAKEDWKNFGFLNADTGAPRDKLHYAARWAGMVHRTEQFWTECAPMPGVARVAMLMPRRDVLLADRSYRGIKKGSHPSRWGYPENHRWMVFRWLREQGYLVDVIPYGKLNDTFLKNYQGLFLVGADHLTAGEATAVKKYVEEGGTLVADSAPGMFDDHHRVRNQLQSLLGMNLTLLPETTDLSLQSDKRTFKARTQVAASAAGAKVIAADGKKPLQAYLNQVGKGRTLYLPFMLGSLELTQPTGAIDGSGVVPEDGPTADSEEYRANDDEFAIGSWLRDMLARVNVEPAYRWRNAASAPKVRVEQPMADARGNAAIVISNRAQSTQETIPAGTVEIGLPADGPWTRAYWAPAEHDGLTAVTTVTDGGRVSVSLPEIRTAGVLYFFKDHAPLMGIPQITAAERGNDGLMAKVRPDKPFDLSVDCVNPTNRELTSSTLNVMAPAGWRVEPTSTPVRLKAGEKAQIRVRVTPDFSQTPERPDWFYPIVARLNDGGRDVAVINANVEIACDPQRVPHVLTDNKHFPKTYPYLTETGATYEYADSTDKGGISDPVRPGAEFPAGRALQNGFSNAKTGIPFSGARAMGYYAKYPGKSADVVFDLKDARKVMQVQVTPGPGRNFPNSLKVLLSDDGQNYREATNLTAIADPYVISTPRITERARFVRLQVTWPEPGGTLDEVEIWGR